MSRTFSRTCTFARVLVLFILVLMAIVSAGSGSAVADSDNDDDEPNPVADRHGHIAAELAERADGEDDNRDADHGEHGSNHGDDAGVQQTSEERSGVPVSFPVGGIGEEGSPCMYMATQLVGSEVEADALRSQKEADYEAWAAQQDELREIGRDGYVHTEVTILEAPGCEGGDDDEGEEGPQLDPGQVREAIVHQLPRPDPNIDPGWALTGMPAYLEVNADTTFDETVTGEAIPVPVTVAGEGSYRVEWGDGTADTYHSGGGPYPDGDIVHVYVDKDEELVVMVTPVWEVTWSALGISVPLVIELEPEMLELPVREMRSVRTNDADQ